MWTYKFWGLHSRCCLNDSLLGFYTMLYLSVPNSVTVKMEAAWNSGTDSLYSVVSKPRWSSFETCQHVCEHCCRLRTLCMEKPCKYWNQILQKGRAFIIGAHLLLGWLTICLKLFEYTLILVYPVLVLCLFSLMPRASLHYLLICTLSFIV
jgi:hypothetical protein